MWAILPTHITCLFWSLNKYFFPLYGRQTIQQHCLCCQWLPMQWLLSNICIHSVLQCIGILFSNVRVVFISDLFQNFCLISANVSTTFSCPIFKHLVLPEKPYLSAIKMRGQPSLSDWRFGFFEHFPGDSNFH